MPTLAREPARNNENKAETVASRLAEMILSGELLPGSSLTSERTLAATMGVSRNALREAIKVLQSRGLVTIKHGMRTIVNGVSSEPVQQAVSGALYGKDDALLQLTEARIMLEVGIAELAARRATKRDIEKLRKLVLKLDASLDDPPLYAETDIAFHRALAEATHNLVFPLILDSLAGLLHESLQTALNYGPPQMSIEVHHRIFEAVANRDSALAAAMMRSHLNTQLTQFEQVFRKHLA